MVPHNRAPSWIELESIVPLEAGEGTTSAETITSLSADTICRTYPEWVVRLARRRLGMKLKHALKIAGTDFETKSEPAKLTA